MRRKLSRSNARRVVACAMFGVLACAGIADRVETIRRRHVFVDAYHATGVGMSGGGVDAIFGRSADHVCGYRRFRVKYYVYPATRLWTWTFGRGKTSKLPAAVDSSKDLPYICEGTAQIAFAEGDTVVGKAWQCDSGLPGDPAAAIPPEG